jgi:hypothetical protein
MDTLKIQRDVLTAINLAFNALKASRLISAFLATIHLSIKILNIAYKIAI